MLKCEKIKEIGLKERRKKVFVYFYWFGKTKSFAYIPEWDQNVVRGRKSSGWFWLILKFEKKKSLGKVRGRKGIEEIKEVSSIDFKLEKMFWLIKDWLKIWLRKKE